MGVCASAPDFRVRYGAGAFKRVLLSRGASPADIKEAVAGAVGVAVGTFFVRSAASGAVAPLHAGLVGDWEVELLPAMAQAQAPTGVAAAGRPDDLLLAAVERLGERIEATGQQTVEMLRQIQETGQQTVEMLRQVEAAIAGVRQRLSPPREGGVGRIFRKQLPALYHLECGLGGTSVASGRLSFDALAPPGGGSGGGGGGGGGGEGVA